MFRGTHCRLLHNKGTCFTLPYLNSKGKVIGGGEHPLPPPIYIRQK